MANKGILGRKLGMTQVFDEGNRIVPVTVIEDLGHAEFSAQDPFVRHEFDSGDIRTGRKQLT